MSYTLRIVSSLIFDLSTADEAGETISPDVMLVDKRPSNDQDFWIFVSLEQVLKQVSPDFMCKQSEQFCNEIMFLFRKFLFIAELQGLLSIWWSSPRKPSESKEMK